MKSKAFFTGVLLIVAAMGLLYLFSISIRKPEIQESGVAIWSDNIGITQSLQLGINNETREIIRISYEYQELYGSYKRQILSELKKWIEVEETKLNDTVKIKNL